MKISRRVGNTSFLAWAAYVAGRAATAAGHRGEAKTHLFDTIRLQAEYGLQLMLPDSVEALAEAVELDDPVEATRLLAAAEGARNRLGIARVPADANRWAALQGRLRAVLGEMGYDTATADGRALALDDITTSVVRSAPLPAPKPGSRTTVP